jgi:hypothetical protein
MSTLQTIDSHHTNILSNHQKFSFPSDPVKDRQLVQKHRGENHSRIVEIDIIITISSSETSANNQSSISTVLQFRQSQSISTIIIITIVIPLKLSLLLVQNDLLTHQRTNPIITNHINHHHLNHE